MALSQCELDMKSRRYSCLVVLLYFGSAVTSQVVTSTMKGLL